ncbi:putative F-box domain-containing protein [Rosa chinensis]|uniref:Putative F-box domain-containing protein n=1 Tax=Rosa chinensis TaxID=74649 RepID=A0A2P6PXA4_ROSCH|nr:putative F-box domain-containing protein [Rosa chinensis]
MEMELDRISNLPSDKCDVIDKILSHLPLRDVARTCVLSSKWRFKLSQGCKHLRDIDRWILHLSRYSLKQFVVDLWEGQPMPRYKMPSCMFSCQDIIHLKLRNFPLKPRLHSKGSGV